MGSLKHAPRKPLSLPPASLKETPEALHWAAQLTSVAADAAIDRAADDSHTNWQWNEDSFALIGREFREREHRINLQLAPLAVAVVKDQKAIEVRELGGYETRRRAGMSGLGAVSASESLDRPQISWLRNAKSPRPHSGFLD